MAERLERGQEPVRLLAEEQRGLGEQPGPVVVEELVLLQELQEEVLEQMFWVTWTPTR